MASLKDTSITGTLSVSGAPTFTTAVPVASGGTGATSASAALTNLGAQAALVSGTNIKTVGGTSILGSGDIVVGETAWTANDSRAKTALNASGSAPIYACRAWVNFNGTGTVAIRASGNVSSITDNGTGDYTVNFTTAMVDANYSVSGISSANTTGYGDAGAIVLRIKLTVAPTTSAVRLVNSSGTASIVDCMYCNVSVFR